MTETSVRTTAKQLESEPHLSRERNEQLVDIRLDIGDRGARPVWWLALWRLGATTVLALAVLLTLLLVSEGENPPPDPSQRVAEPAAIGMVAIFILVLCVLPTAIARALWVRMVTAPRQRERDEFQAKARAMHDYAWRYVRCCCLFENEHAPGNLPAGVAIPWSGFRHRLWKAVGFRRDVV